MEATTRLQVKRIDDEIGFHEGVIRGLRFARALLVGEAGHETPGIGEIVPAAVSGGAADA